jgi:hypothetical protein
MKNFIGKYFKICPRTGRFLGLRLHSDLSRLLLPLTGLAALIWILIRVVPKPSRTQYPCVQAATPLASSFVLYIASWLGSAFFIKKARKYFRESRFILFLSSLVLGIILATSSFLQTHQDVRAAARSVLENPNQPMGASPGSAIPRPSTRLPRVIMYPSTIIPIRRR